MLFNALRNNLIVLYLFCCSVCSSCDRVELFQWLLCHFEMHHPFVFLITSSLSGTTRCSTLILHSSFPSPGTFHFSKEPWFLSLDNRIRNQVPGASYACCYGDVIAASLSQWIEVGNTPVLTDPCVHTYL